MINATPAANQPASPVMPPTPSKAPMSFSPGNAGGMSAGADVDSMNSNTDSGSKPLSPKKKLNPKVILGVIVLLLLLIGGLASYMLMQMNQDTRQQASTDEWYGRYGLESKGNGVYVFLGCPDGSDPADFWGFYCNPDTATDRCSQNGRSFGSMAAGTTFNINDYAGTDPNCLVQLDWNTPGSAANAGNCAALKFEKCSTGGTGGGGTSPQPTIPGTTPVSSPKTSPKTSPTVSSKPKVSPTPAPQCLNVTMTLDQPKVGHSVAFICGHVVGATEYRFRVIRKIPGQTAETFVLGATNRRSDLFKIDKAGKYVAQCQICYEDSNGKKVCPAFETLSAEYFQ